jgi:hypothetical protein
MAAAVVRLLSDDQLERKGMVLVGASPMSAEQRITGGLLDPIDERFWSIHKTVCNERLGGVDTTMTSAVVASFGDLDLPRPHGVQKSRKPAHAQCVEFDLCPSR